MNVAPLRARTAGVIFEGDALTDASKAIPTLQQDFAVEQVELGKMEHVEESIQARSPKQLSN